MNRTRVEKSYDAFISAPFSPEVNGVRLARALRGNFNALARYLAPMAKDMPSYQAIPAAVLRKETDRLAGGVLQAAQVILADIARVEDASGKEASLRVIVEPEMTIDLVGDVSHVFHRDRGQGTLGRFLCSYNLAATEGLENEDARRYVEVPAFRAAAARQFDALAKKFAGISAIGPGGETEDFKEDIERKYGACFFPKEGAQPFSFGLGHLWRMATLNNPPGVPSLIHRAPHNPQPDVPRLLLVSG